MIFTTTATISKPNQVQNDEGTVFRGSYTSVYSNIPCDVQPDDGTSTYGSDGISTDLVRIIIFIEPTYIIKKGYRVVVDSMDLISTISYFVPYSDHIELICFEDVS